MLHDIIISKTRVSVLIKLFLNSDNTTYLRELVAELDISNNAVRKELNHLEKVGLLKTYMISNKRSSRPTTNIIFSPTFTICC